MTKAREVISDEFFAGRPDALAAFAEVCAILDQLGPFEVRITKSEAAFRRRLAFAYLWMPGRYLRNPAAQEVLSIVLGRIEASGRFKEVVHPSRRHWIHHLESPACVTSMTRLWTGCGRPLTVCADRPATGAGRHRSSRRPD